VSGPLSYVSTETVLQIEGIIFQNISKITLMGRKRLEFKVSGVEYLCRYLNPRFLVSREGIVDSIRYSVATVGRATADILNVNPKYYLDNKLAVKKSNWKAVSRRVGYL